MSDILTQFTEDLNYEQDFVEVWRDGNDHAYIAKHDITVSDGYQIDVNDVVIESCETECLGDDYYNNLYEANKMILLNICHYLKDINFEEVLEMVQAQNGYDWYVVVYDDSTPTYNRVELKHATSLSNVLECGHNPSEYGIEAMYQCGND